MQMLANHLKQKEQKQNSINQKARRAYKTESKDLIMNKFIKCACLLVLASAPAHAMDRKRNHAEEMWPTADSLTRQDLATLKKARAANLQDKFGELLITAARDGNIQGVAELLWRGAPVNYQSSQDSNTALMYAVANGHFVCTELLLAAGADVTTKNNDGRTALNYALKKGDHNFEALLQAYLNNAHDQQAFMETYLSQKLIEAVKKDNVTLVRQLVKKSASANNRALIKAAKHGRLACVEELIAANAQVNCTDSKGNTALIWAASKNHIPCIKALIDAGADIHHKNEDDRTALTFAAKNRYFKAEYAIRKEIDATRSTNK